ncbi:inner-membrane translocator [Dethiosulfovibrio peptidovorans DSM 11002]|uniref:Inner-membrane translocator n=1 Tax=Dethiosulfovibrio peptidovorans DSM 11002 TaxID=469381 RepID=D2Z2Y7_9BACT|nr:branched-chain amino acid ABC transporter permease [Dethiosulfovibrio peptidovorans]EFC90205.1 inner-membrane translocator [Dethiosulfovibrio peptidovorans DSM 11002]
MMESKKTKNLFLNALLLVVVVGLLWWAPENLDGYKIQILNLIAIYSILGLSLNLIYGFTGMFSLGTAGFMCIGAYVSSLLILPEMQKDMIFILEPLNPILYGAHAPFVVAVLAGGVAAAIAGLIIGIPVLRLGGDYLGIATLGFAEIIRVVANNIPTITNGALGLKGIPAYANLWWNYGWMFFTLYVMYRLVNSNFGNALKAIRDDELAAKAMGINTFKYRVISFTVGSFFAGIGGALMASLLTTIDPKMFMVIMTYNVLMVVVAGGLGSLSGSVIGAVVVTVLLEWLRFVENPITLGSFEIPGVPGMRMVIFALSLIMIILYRPEGVMGNKELSWEGLFGLGKGGKDHE